MRSIKSSTHSRSRKAAGIPAAFVGNTSRNVTSPARLQPALVAFWPLVFLMLCLWVAYRLMFQFPVWFDEVFGKAVFFGLPVLLFAVVGRRRDVVAALAPRLFQHGLILGVLLGGIFGFVAAIASLLKTGAVVQTAPLFLSDSFWSEFFLAIMTGFWESLFFFGLVMTLVWDKYRSESLPVRLALVVGVFLVFHVPNTLIRFGVAATAGQLFLLFCFSLGQGLVFLRTRNLYALTLSHAIWGMVLLIHTQL